MKYRTRLPTCSLHGLYTSGSLDTTLSLYHPSKILSCRMSPCFACKSDTLLHSLEQETQAVEGGKKKKGKKKKVKKEESNFLMQKNKSSASVKRPQIFKIQMKAVFSTQFYKRNPLSSGNRISLESLRYYSSWTNGETDLVYRLTRWKPIYSTLSCK